jgi:hypothetical protein
MPSALLMRDDVASLAIQGRGDYTNPFVLSATSGVGYGEGVYQLIFANPKYKTFESSTAIENAIEPEPITHEISDLGDSSYTLNQPIQISLTTYPLNEVSAEWAEVGLQEESNSEAGAISELKKAIRDLYDDIANMPDDKLGGYMLNYKKILNKTIVKS